MIPDFTRPNTLAIKYLKISQSIYQSIGQQSFNQYINQYINQTSIQHIYLLFLIPLASPVDWEEISSSLAAPPVVDSSPPFKDCSPSQIDRGTYRQRDGYIGIYLTYVHKDRK